MTIDIMTMLDKSIKNYTTAGVTLYSTGGTLKKDPSHFTRKEKLAYIESAYSKYGNEAMKESRFLLEIRASSGLSVASYKEAQREGMRRYNRATL